MSESKRVLVVEDEPLIAMDIQAELEERGWEVVGPAGTVAKALELANREEFAVAVLDINLGGSKSFEVADLLEDRRIPVVFLSGDSGGTRPDAVKDRQILPKPINYERLVDVLESSLT